MFLPCSTSELVNFRVQSSFRIDVFVLRQDIKNDVILAYCVIFCEVLTEKSILKPIHPYVNAAFGTVPKVYFFVNLNISLKILSV